METREELIKKFTLAKEIIEKRDCLLDQIESFEDDIEEDEDKLYPSSVINDLKTEQQKHPEPYEDNGQEIYLSILKEIFVGPIKFFIEIGFGNALFCAVLYYVLDNLFLKIFFNTTYDIFHPDSMTLIYIYVPLMFISLLVSIKNHANSLTFNQRKHTYETEKAEIDKKLLMVETNNKTIDSRNAERRKKVAALTNQLEAIYIRWNNEASSWYPEDYKTLDAVEFFIKKLKNYQADTKSEVINLYDEYLHRKNLENLQRKSYENQLVAQRINELQVQDLQQELQQGLNDVRENHQASQDEIMDKLNEMDSKNR